MLQAFRSRLEYKILLLIIAVLIVGFGTYVIITIRQESNALMERQRETLRASSEALMAGIRNVMLTGKSTYASELVNDIRQNLRFVDVNIYDRLGREVFLREGEGVNPNVNDPMVAKTLETKTPQEAMSETQGVNVFTRYQPLINRPECWRCHDKSEPIRGAIEVALTPSVATMMKGQNAIEGMASSIGNVIATAFRMIMLGGNGDQMDTLMATARQIPGVEMVQVYSKDGFLHFGPEVYEIPDTTIMAMTAVKNHEIRFERGAKKLRMFIPLENEDRCQVCHGQKFPMRGVMVIDFDAALLRHFSSDPEKLFTDALQSAIVEGFRSIMLVGRANSVRFFMDELRNQSVLQTVRVFDKVGSERFLNPPPRKLEHFTEVVEKLDTLEYVRTENGEERLVRVTHMANQIRCHACHGGTQKVRAAVEVSASMSEINAAILSNKIRSVAVGIVTIFLAWVVIRFYMNSVVVRPVQGIERVAARVGEGDFTARAEFTSSDEIGSLASKINDMVRGLHERFHLEKFVSQQTVEAVRRSDQAGVRLGGERKIATVFFSDLRGFTSYSEKVEPEQVVSMLNATLADQAEVVKRHGGDIDKYVGDEMVAVFTGEKMVERAISAAVEIQRRHRLRSGPPGEQIGIGIGINSGDMVMGAMGSAERMDYTVIGDNVNLGARLCSVALPHQILVSEFSAARLERESEFQLVPLDPVAVKGKQAPVKVFEVRYDA
ncbi:MAG TPA: adenylate/guanylate cyclase domain-containing protein [Bacteroidota bacterium]|nr:adenylate/guanylate cyclase domain-containing protein [Bacteroidota bacterium]